MTTKKTGHPGPPRRTWARETIRSLAPQIIRALTTIIEEVIRRGGRL
jgi:hypothetical protein